MPKKNITLDDLAGAKEKLVFPVQDMMQFKEDLSHKFGEFSQRGLYRFYQKAGIANVVWGKKKSDGTVEKFSYGKLLSVCEYPLMDGNKIWKGYTLKGSFPFTFWEELYLQTCKHIEKTRFVEQKKIEGLEQLAAGIGEEIHE